MSSFQILTPDDASRWNSILPASRSVFGSFEFATIAAAQRGFHPRLFVFSEGESVVSYPLFLRPLEPLAGKMGTSLCGWDTVSPEYTGPIADTRGRGVSRERFRDCFSKYCQEEGIIAEFAHIHPWKCATGLLDQQNVHLDREIVYVDLTLADDQLWYDSFSHACRKNIKRALREALHVFRASTPQDIEQFHSLYLSTMERRGARANYYYPLSYFLKFFEQMSDHAAFFLARHKDQIVAGTLFLHDDTDVYSYLGGADARFQQLRSVNAILYETIKWARSLGKRRLVLGGGYEPNDGIFRFKASFSPLRSRFCVYKSVHAPLEYALLCQAWLSTYGRQPDLNGYFPPYRSTPTPITS